MDTDLKPPPLRPSVLFPRSVYVILAHTLLPVRARTLHHAGVTPNVEVLEYMMVIHSIILQSCSKPSNAAKERSVGCVNALNVCTIFVFEEKTNIYIRRCSSTGASNKRKDCLIFRVE